WPLVLALGGAPGAVAADVFAAAPEGTPAGWRTGTPRDELRPQFSFDPEGGRSGQGGFEIACDARDGLLGFWTTTLPVVGGQVYRFSAFRKIDGIGLPRRSVVARLVWRDASGRLAT